MKRILLVMMYVPLILNAQTENSDQGIRFEQGLSWSQVLAKAKAENKYIFFDCYATWCGPCKEMDKNIYPLPEVGEKFNDKFVSIKLQMDKTDKDDGQVKYWNLVSRNFAADYSIVVYPTYLFLSPNGKVVHKATGYKDKDAFLAVIDDVLNPQKQYYTILENFKPGSIDTAEMKGLARSYIKQKKDELAGKIALDYFNRIPAKERFIEQNLEFWSQFRMSAEIQDIAFNYLNKLSKNEFVKKKNVVFAVNFCNSDKRVQELCIEYLKALSLKDFSDTSNLKLAGALNSLPEVQALAITYFNKLEIKKIGYPKNLKFFSHFRANETIQKLAHDYIGKLSQKDIQNKSIIEFVDGFTYKTIDPGFLLFYKYPDKMNAVLKQKDFARKKTDGIISFEEINPVLESDNKNKKDPLWEQIIATISKKYDTGAAERTVLAAKIRWYEFHGDWEKQIKYSIEQINRYGMDSVGFWQLRGLNNLCWEAIFLHSNDTSQLIFGIKIMETVLRNESYNVPAHLDTYANLLYKMGKIDKALAWESKALELLPNSRTFKDTYEKMKKGLPTWTEN